VAAGREEQRFRREQADFESLFRSHYAEIVRYLAVRLGSRERASDLASEVFLEAYRRVPLLRWRGRPVLAWLYRVAANMAADELRRSAREAPLPDAEPAVEERDQAEDLAEREALAKALRALPSDYQLVVHLRLVEGYPFSEVARMTGRSVGACQMQLLRAGRLLRTSLEGEGIRAPA
jgi:RNA polymerase sigma-70 factor (ECF subfamily)